MGSFPFALSGFLFSSLQNPQNNCVNNAIMVPGISGVFGMGRRKSAFVTVGGSLRGS
jgi:hypothetical protein